MLREIQTLDIAIDIAKMVTAFCCPRKESNLREKKISCCYFLSCLILYLTHFLAVLIPYLNITKYPLLKGVSV